MPMISIQEKTRRLFAIEGMIDPPTDRYFQDAISHNFRSLFKNGFCGEIPFSEIYPEFTRAIVMHWVVKEKIAKKHKHPWARESQPLKHLADVYSAVWDGMSAIMNFSNSFADTNGYECTSQWFALILKEYALCRSDGRGVKAVASQLQGQNQILTDIKNRKKGIEWLSKILDQRYKPHTYHFFKMLCTCHHDGLMDDLRLECLAIIIKAMKAHCTHVREEVDGVIVGNSLISGRGRGEIKYKDVLVNRESLTNIGV